MTTLPGLAAERTSSWLSSKEVRDSLPLVEAGLRRTLERDDGLMNDVCGRVIRTGGKRLRPTLVLLAGTYGAVRPARLVSLAVATELLHVATLMHDDVFDAATTRRRVRSANAEWGSLIATFAGNYLFAQAADMFDRDSRVAAKLVRQAVECVWQGQARETEAIYRLDIEEAWLLETLRLKTAALFELPCRLGASVARVSDAYSLALSGYGRDLGIAFQVTDDIMDMVADESELGKPPGIDLMDGVYTLPVVHALRAGGSDGQRLRALLGRVELGQDELREVLTILVDGGAVAYSLSVARNFTNSARQHLEALPDDSRRESLDALATSVLQRCHRVSGGQHWW